MTTWKNRALNAELRLRQALELIDWYERERHKMPARPPVVKGTVSSLDFVQVCLMELPGREAKERLEQWRERHGLPRGPSYV